MAWLARKLAVHKGSFCRRWQENGSVDYPVGGRMQRLDQLMQLPLMRPFQMLVRPASQHLSLSALVIV